jgi:glycosyltransferase involved in cell wall biosynthesis
LSRSGLTLPVELLFVGANAQPAPRPRPVGAQPRRLGIFSMMGRTRRFDLMIEAFAMVAARHPHSELVLIGDLASNQQLFRQLLAQIAASPVADRIRLTGALPLPRVATEVASLDVYLMPDETGASTRSGTLPIALGSGVPVVATRGPETDETFFVDGHSIVYADEMSSASLARAALQVLDDPVLARRVGSGGQALYERHLSWPSIAERFLAPGGTARSESHGR